MNEIIGKITTVQTINGRISVAGINKVVSNVDDVQINGTSIVDENRVANIPIASSDTYGLTTVTGEEVNQIKESLVDKNLIKHITDEMTIDEVLKLPTGYYHFDNWVDVNDEGTAWENASDWGFEGLMFVDHLNNGNIQIVSFSGSWYYEFSNNSNIPVKFASLICAYPQNNQFGIGYLWDRGFYVIRASNDYINERINNHTPIVPKNLDYAVKQAMCDGKGAKWTEAEKVKAQERIGIVVITQEEYDLLEVKGENTIYIIT